jgi:hypothetical protein
LNKKKQKFKAIRQPPFTPQSLPRMVVRSELPKPAALLPTYAVVSKKALFYIKACKYGGRAAKNASRHSGELRIQGFSPAQRERKIRRIPRGGLSIFLACLF